MKYLAVLVGALVLVTSSAHAQDEISGELHSLVLGEQRHLQISLPRTYGYADRSYPVLYVLDGEWAYDYARGAASFMSNEITGYIPEMIVVGIYNTNRTRDTRVTQDPDAAYNKYLDFIQHEVIVHVDSLYRTNEFRMIYGWSSASAVASQFLFERPQVFDAFINSGSGIGRRGKRYAERSLPEYDLAGKYYYAEAEAGPREPAIELLGGMLDSLSLAGLQYRVEVVAGETHLDVLSSGVRRGLEFVFDDFQLDDELIARDVQAIVGHFESLSAQYGMAVVMPEGAFVEAASLLEQAGRSAAATDLLVRGLQIHPSSSAIPGAIGEMYYWSGDIEAARQYYELALLRAATQGEAQQNKYRILLRDLEKAG